MTRILARWLFALALTFAGSEALASNTLGNIAPTNPAQPNVASTLGSGHYTANDCLVAGDTKGSIVDFGGACATGFGTQTSIASAGTTDLGTLTTNSALVTGTTTITSFGSSASTTKPYWLVEFNNTLTLTYNASSLITPTGASITTAANGFAILMYRGSGNWTVLSYQPPVQATASTPTIHSQTFVSSGTFTFPSGTTSSTPFSVIAIGGGAGGGSNSGGSGGGGGGGGSGCAAHYVISGFAAGQNATITIGAGGAGSSNSASAGANGSASTFVYASNTVVSAGGGAGGASGAAGATTAGGNAGTCTSNFTGLTLIDSIATGIDSAGGNGTYPGGGYGFGGAGGSNPMGNGGPSVFDTATHSGANAAGYGGGGAGGASGGSQSTGGNGSNGAVIVQWVL